MLFLVLLLCALLVMKVRTLPMGSPSSLVASLHMPTSGPSRDERDRSVLEKSPAEQLTKSAVTSALMSRLSAIHIVRKPLRDINFWGRVLQIYGSYKIQQAKTKLGKLSNHIRLRQRRKAETTRGECVEPIIIADKGAAQGSVSVASGSAEQVRRRGNVTASWDECHEINSQRMIDLCLRMRGFYLKTGQFLGTRHDFMPQPYTSKLGKLHDNVPPMSARDIRAVLERELRGPIEEYFSTLDLDEPIGSASVAQVHKGVWRATGQPVAVKVQYPNAERLMTGDLQNLRALAEFLQRTELKFDILSAIKELQKQIKNEFDFRIEAKNMDSIRLALQKSVPEVILPRSILSTQRALVMSYVEGENLSRLAEYKADGRISDVAKRLAGQKLLDVLSKAWGEMLFELRTFNADPHPGNIRISRKHGIGLLDWGQVKTVPEVMAVKFARFIEAMNSRREEDIVDCFFDLGVKVSNPEDKESVAGIAKTMLDTQRVPGYSMDPFSPSSFIKKNAVIKMPSDLYFVVRTIQMVRGIAYAFDLDYSLARSWGPYARRIIHQHNSSLRESDCGKENQV